MLISLFLIGRAAYAQFLPASILLSQTASSISSHSLVVVVHKENPISQLQKKQVIDIYMGRFQNFPDGRSVTPIDFPTGSAARKHFYEALIGKSERQIKSYWSRLLFSGRATPPIQTGSTSALLLEYTTSGLAYVRVSDITSEMKIVYTL